MWVSVSQMRLPGIGSDKRPRIPVAEAGEGAGTAVSGAVVELVPRLGVMDRVVVVSISRGRGKGRGLPVGIWGVVVLASRWCGH